MTAIPPPVALGALDCILGRADHYMPIRRRRDHEPDRWWWHRTCTATSTRTLIDTIRACDERYSDEILIGAPQASPWNGGVGRCTALWAIVEGTDQLRRAHAFRPRPTIVIRAGASSKRWLLWGLEAPAGYFDVEEANRRIAYALRATQRHGDPDALAVPAPGTCLRVGRARPAPVVVSRLAAGAFTLQAVAGALKPPPPRDAWLQAAGSR